MKIAIIILFHGSRAEGAGGAVQRLIDDIRRRGGYDIVTEAFLYHAVPDFADSLRQCAQEGAAKIVVVPFFLQMGMHVTADIPVLVEKARKHYPGIRVVVTDAVGSHPKMAEIVMDLIGTSDPGMSSA